MKNVSLFLFSIFLFAFSPIFVLGQGTETFTNIPANNSASINRTWTGDDGSTWTAGRARTDQTVNGRAITLNDDQSNAYVESGTLTGGIGNLTITTQRAFGGNSGNMNVSVNGSNVGTIPYSASVQTTTISNINVAGNVVIRIDNNIGGNSGGGDDRVKIDDVTWTAFSAGCSGTPSVQATDLVFSNGDATSVEVDWSAGTGADNYILVVSEADAVTFAPTADADYTGATGSGDYTAATDQGSGDKVVFDGSGTSATVTGLTTGTTYYFQVYAYCEDSGTEAYITTDGSSGNDGSQNYTPTLVYCTVSGDVTYGTSITQVAFGDLSYSSGTGSGYDDFTGQVANVTQGATESLSVNLNTAGTYTVHAFVWVDWNQDGDFDDGNEEYDLGDVYNDANGATDASPLSITVPAGATLGNTRMRVVCRFDNDPTGPCAGTDDGEIEDYTVNVQAASSDTEVEFALASTTLQEDGLFADVCVSITNPSASVATTVDVTLTGGTATNGSDYDDGAGSPGAIVFPQTLTFPANSSTDQCLTIYISNDDLITEGDETIILGLSNVSGGSGTPSIGTQSAHTVTIPENDQPVISATPTSLTGFSTTQGTPSASQSFTLEGDYLSGDLSIAALAGFEYSLDNTTFTSTLTVPVSGGNVTGEPRTIHVRLTGATISAPSGNAVVSGGGATSVNVALDGTVTAAPCASLLKQSWETSGDTWGYTSNQGDATDGYDLSGNYSDDVWTYGTAAQFQGSLTPTDGSRFWGFEDIHNSLTGTAIHRLTFDEINVSAASGLTVEFDWAASGFDGPDYLQYQLVIDGSAQTAVTICSSCTSSGSESISIPNGTTTLSLVLIANQNGNGDFGLFDNVNLCGTGTVSNPVIVASPTSVSGFTTTHGTPSASQSFTLEGDDLSGDLSIAAVTGFEYSLDDVTFTSTLTVPVSGGNVTGEPRTIYVRLTGATPGTPSGDAEVSGGGASSVDVALSGTVNALPCTAPNAVATLGLTPTSGTVDGTITPPAGGASGYVVVRHTTTTLGGTPTNASTYTAGNSIGSGTVVYSGTGTSFTDAGPLSPSTEYFYFVFAYNNTSCSGGPAYAAEFEESTTTLSGPCLSENFDGSTGLPSGWSDSGSANQSNASHYNSAPNCRALGTNDNLVTPSVDYPSSISFYVDASGSGGEVCTLEYQVGAGAWTSIGTFVSDNNGQTETFALNSSPNLTATADVSFRISSPGFTVYIDDVEIFCASAQPSIELSLEAPVSGTGTEAAATTVTLRATASETLTADHSVEVDISGTGIAATDFSGVDFTNTVTIDINNGSSFGEITFNVANDVDVEGPETATFTISNPSSGVVIGTTDNVDLDITDNDNLTSSESVVIEQSGETASISSLVNGALTSSSDGVQVWHFRLYDGDGTPDADSKPTIYTGWVIRQSGGNTVPDWSTVIEDREFFVGSSTTPLGSGGLTAPTSIPSPIINSSQYVTVPDDGFVDIYLRLTLQSTLPAGTDGQHFGFSLDASDVTVESDVLQSSQLGSFTETSDASLNEVGITATLQFIDAPSTVSVGSNFSITVSVVDANGNIDTDQNGAVTLSLTSGAGTLTGTGTQNLSSGTYTFTGLSHDTEETIQVTASSGGFSNINASINVVDEPHQLFDDFNRVDNSVVGIPSSGGSTTWSEDETGDGTKVRIFNGQLMLDNCIDSDPTGTSGGTLSEMVSFDVGSYFETTFSNAAEPLEWVFNMRSNNDNLSGFNSSNYGMGFILGCNQADFTASGSNGYAVVVGESGSADDIRIVEFANGLNSNASLTDVVQSNIDIDDDHASVRVSFDPCDGNWSLEVRNDGGSFTSPASTTPAFSGPFTGNSTTYTGVDLKFFGAIWKHNSGCLGNDAFFDNFNIPTAVTASSTAKVWNGSVNANWNEANNWGPCPGVPTVADDVIIPNVTTQPVVSAATPLAYCKDLTVNTGASITINSARFLHVHGDVVNNGLIDFGQGTLTMEGGPSTLTLSGNVNVANFYVNTTVTLNGTLTVTGIARSESIGIINANGNLVLEDGAQLLHGVGTPTAGGAVNGNIVVKRQGNGSGGFNGWSTPVVGGVLPGSNGYSYNSSLGTNSNDDDNNPDPDDGWQAHSGAMTAGRGYFSVDGGSATFTGVANNGSVAPGVTTSPEPLNSLNAPTFFNLIGNPYPSAIDADQFISDNSGRIDGALYFWSDENAGSAAYSSDDYATYSTGGSVVPLTGGGSSGVPNGSIPSCQGFFVNCDVSGTIDFNNGQRGGNNSQFFRMASPDNQRMWLSINNDDLELFNQTLVAFDEFATDQKDWGVDAYKLRGNQAISIGSIQDGETYVIATYGSIPQSGKVVPLMTYVETAGTYTFIADSLEGFEDYNVFLQDLSDGMMYPLEQGDSHSFAMTSDDEFGRFQLWYSPAIVTGVEEADLTGRIFVDQYAVTVNWDQSVNTSGTLEFVDMAGRTVMSEAMIISNGNGRQILPTLANGIYSVRFVSDDNQRMVSQKLVISK